jgi:hypothetical protein
MIRKKSFGGVRHPRPQGAGRGGSAPLSARSVSGLCKLPFSCFYVLLYELLLFGGYSEKDRLGVFGIVFRRVPDAEEISTHVRKVRSSAFPALCADLNLSLRQSSMSHTSVHTRTIPGGYQTGSAQLLLDRGSRRGGDQHPGLQCKQFRVPDVGLRLD